MKYTLNQIEALISKQVNDHAQLNEFVVCEVDEIDTKTNKFPLVWMYYLPSIAIDKELQIKARIAVMDLVDKDISNLSEVYSDSLLQLMDIRAMLLNPANEDFFMIDDNVNLDHFKDRFDSEVAGWYMDVTFRIADLKDRCQIPVI